MVEKQYVERQCRICFNVVARIHDGKFPNGRDKKFVDLNGKLWNGKICPGCTRLLSRSRYLEERKKPRLVAEKDLGETGV